MVICRDRFKTHASKIIDGSDDRVEYVETIKHLRKILSKQNLSSPPKLFLCPLSKKTMNNPVTLVSGETYERVYIERWLQEVNCKTCPKTLEPLKSTQLIPNKAISSLILQWCKENLVDLPETVAAYSDKVLVHTLMNKISSSSVYSQREGAKELHCHVRLFPTFCFFLVSEGSDTITKLLHPLLNPGADIDPELQRELIKTIFYLSVQEGNRVFIAQNPLIIKTLMSSLKQGSKETQEDAAATLSLLSSSDSNRQPIGSAGVFKPLIVSLEDDDASAYNTLSNLCVLEENRARAIQEGVVSILTRKAKAVVLVDRILPLMALLSAHEQAAKEMTDPDFLQILFSVIRVPALFNKQVVEKAVIIICNVCKHDEASLQLLQEEENLIATVSRLQMHGTERVQKIVSAFLKDY